MQPICTRRRLLTIALSMAGASGLVRAPFVLAAEGALETTTVRIFANRPGICVAPQYIAEPLLQAEGFTDVRFVGLTATTGAPAAPAVASGNADFTVTFAAPLAVAIDGGASITLLSGVHVGCFELFGNEGVRSITDLKGKSVGVLGFGSSQHVYAALMAAYVGLDPTKDIHWAITRRPSRRSFTKKARSTHLWAFRRSPRICGSGTSGTWWSTAPSTAPGRSISAACSLATVSLSAKIRSRPSGCCAPS